MTAAYALARPVLRVLWKWPRKATPGAASATRPKISRHLSRHADADRVGNRDLEGLGLRDLAGDVDDTLHRHLALERTAERGGYRDLGANSGGMGGRGHFAPGADRVRARDALVPAVELVGREHDHADLAAARRGGTIEARPVQDQPDIGDVVAPGQ